jgi:uncharacterized membrane protein
LTVTLRRRLDGLVLRWQARLDSEWADRVLPWLIAAGLFILLAALSLATARSLDANVDLAAYTQAAWLIREGAEPVITVTDNAHILAQQASFAFYPMVAFTYVLPIIPALLVIQAAALSLAVVPLWKIARRLANLRVGAAGTLVFVYAFYPVVHNLNLDGFHPEVIAVPGLLAAFYFGATRRWIPFAAFALIVILARADLGLAVAGLGALMVLQGDRRAGVITMVASVGWTLVAAVSVQPAFGDGSFPHMAAFAEFGDSPASVAWGIITQPLDVLAQLFREQNFNLAVTLLAPVVFLPVLAPRYLVPVLPLQFLYMIADVQTEAVFGQQTVAITAYVFIATAFALSRIGRKGVEQVIVDRRMLGALLLAGSVFFIRDAASSPYREPWAWGGQDLVDQARIEAADAIPEDANLRASRSMVQLLAERETLYTLDTAGRVDPASAAAGVDYVVFDESEAMEWTAVQQQIFREGLRTSGFRVVFDTEGIVVFEHERPRSGRSP